MIYYFFVTSKLRDPTILKTIKFSKWFNDTDKTHLILVSS